MTKTDQYRLETTWSTRLIDDIVYKVIQGDTKMWEGILGHITNLNTHNFVDNKENTNPLSIEQTIDVIKQHKKKQISFSRSIELKNCWLLMIQVLYVVLLRSKIY